MIIRNIISLIFGLILVVSCQHGGGNYYMENVSLEEEDYWSSNDEEYNAIVEHPFRNSLDQPLSTFSIDVDNAAYTNIRRFIFSGQLPPANAVRIEEMINYFDYNYPQPKEEHPFNIITESADCPWNPGNQLLQIGLQGKRLKDDEMKPSNLVFLIDVSGSMEMSNKLPLVKKSLNILLENLNENDRVALVVYAGAAGLVLPSTPAHKKTEIYDAINRLEAGGSTAGGEGIHLAYKVAKENFMPNGNNRVILASDGDFNVGITSEKGLLKLIQEKRESGVFLTVCGFGMGNLKDGRMEAISNAGNGNYFYIDDQREAKKVFSQDFRANMYAIAKDVKIQIEFNPKFVSTYRLIGYENRQLQNKDFENDKKDAGELGAGHTVTAIYEIVPANKTHSSGIDLKYQEKVLKTGNGINELGHIKFRYKPLDNDKSTLITHNIVHQPKTFEAASRDFKFSCSVAGFGLLLRNSSFKENLTYRDLLEFTEPLVNKDKDIELEFLEMIKKAAQLQDI
ncbi:vWA domain-containing protein [Flexithrix dorotheae]|uniref:vWA domain-containing protein n=1 Tax=Flexithrix dorotheae TaxID=70993 RepID=UPI00037762D6|nr:VWA domain-containing protein [Flexithrix dorotheae]